MSDQHRGGPPASPALRDEGEGPVAPGPDGRRPLANAVAAARGWLTRTFGALTWKVFGVFGLVVVVIGLCQPAAFYALFFDIPLPGMPVRKPVPGMPTGIIGLAKAIATQFLLFTPVLIAVVAVESRRFRTERARVLALVAAMLLGQAVGTLLWSLAHPIFYANGFFRTMANHLATIGPLRYFGGLGIRSLAYSGAAIAFYYFVRRHAEAAATLHRAQIGHEAVERESTEARMQVMQAQIEPHFLFNTLASVRRLYQVDRGSGRAMLQHLVRYLTASLPRMRESRSTLERELALALAYLNVQKIRMESRLTFEVDVPRPLEAHVVPPMMLATLVENAVIHGVSPLPDGGHIRISARADAEKLVLEVADDGAGLQENWGAGVGLSNIRARLASAFGQRARLKLSQGSDRGVTATIELPLAAFAEARMA
jgi:two-component sensor histidine kinase